MNNYIKGDDEKTSLNFFKNNEQDDQDHKSFNKIEFKDRLDEELKNFYDDLICITEENDQLKKIQTLILYLKSSGYNQASEIKCTYYIGEIIENVQYLKTTNSIYNVGMIFDLFVKVSSNLNDQSNFDYLLEIYNEIQGLVDQILSDEKNEIAVNLLNFTENNNFIIKIIILLETSKVINHYKEVMNEQSLVQNVNLKRTPNQFVNLVTIQAYYSKLPVSSKIKLVNLIEIYKNQKSPSFLINLIDAKLNQYFGEKFELT